MKNLLVVFVMVLGVSLVIGKAFGQEEGSDIVSQAKTHLANLEEKAKQYASESLGWASFEETKELKKLGAPAALPIAEFIKDKSKDKFLRSKVITQVAAEIKDKQVVEAMEIILKDKSENKNLRMQSAVALGQLADKEALVALREAAKDINNDKDIRATSAVELGRKDMADVVSIGDLTVLLKDEVKDVRQAAAGALGGIGRATGNRSMVDALLDTMKNDEWDIARGAAMFSLASMKEPKALEPIIQQLESGNFYAAQALGELGDKRAVPALIEQLQNKDGLVKRYAARALVKLNAKEAVGALKSAAQSTEIPSTKSILEKAAEDLSK